eukprot:SAG31_NODE_1342_length_8700_cov_12.667829_7_plen_513_part_00
MRPERARTSDNQLLANSSPMPGIMMKVGLLNPQQYMTKYIRELREPPFSYDIDIIECDETDASEEHIAQLAKRAQDNGVPAVVGLAQKDSWQHSLINRKMGSKSISSLAYLVAMNKYMQRVIEQKTDYMQSREFFMCPVTPETETDEEILAKIPDNEWPIMLKNTSLSLGNGVFRCKDPAKVKSILAGYRANAKLRQQIKQTNDSIMQYFDDEDTKKLETEYGGVVPPFLLEHCVDLTLGWVEYCFEGAVSEDGTFTLYGFTEEVYSTEHAGIAYMTPPVSWKRENIPQLEAYLRGYMEPLIKQGYIRQFFNCEIWGLEMPDGSLEFAWCEINPRCAHAYHIPYQIAYGTNLWADNFELVVNDKAPTETPWNKWIEGKYDVSVQILINVMGCQGKRADEILDYSFVDHIDPLKVGAKAKVELVRHVKQRDYVITADDAASGAGCTLMQIFVKCKAHEEAAAYEVAVRDLIYKIKQDDEQMDWWKDLAAKGNVDATKAKLTEGMAQVSVVSKL